MTEFTSLEQQELAEGFLVANTPASFQRWLERNSAVRRVSETLSEGELLDHIHRLLRVTDKTERIVATAYAYLVALISKRKRGGDIGVLPISPESLRWAQAMWTFAKRQNVATSRISIGMQPTMQIHDVPGSSAPRLYGPDGQPIMTIRN